MRVVLLAVPALICLHTAAVADEDVWWHLRTGEWIVAHRAVPRFDPFSRSVAEGGVGGAPWVAYSWMFDCLILQLYRRWALLGVLAYSTGMVLAITAAMHRLLSSLERDATKAALLTAGVMIALSPLYSPRPWLLSVLLFILELDLLMRARQSGQARGLLWLPVLFAVWANVHIQFVDGLIVLGLLAIEATLAKRRSIETRLPPVAVWLALGGCTLAVMANHYGWHIYRVAYDLAAQSGPMRYVQEMQAIPFRRLGDFLLLAMTLGAAAMLGRRRGLSFFTVALLVFAALASFRAQRDLWLVAIAAAVILAQGPRETDTREAEDDVPLVGLVGFACGAILFGAWAMGIREAKLQSSLAKTLPVNAVEAVRARGYTGPLYNTYEWGGYLMWSLRQPVSLDGRAGLYGDKRIEAALKTWAAEPDWGMDATFLSAKLVIAPRKQALTQVLRLAPPFVLVYEDEVAAVFVRR